MLPVPSPAVLLHFRFPVFVFSSYEPEALATVLNAAYAPKSGVAMFPATAEKAIDEFPQSKIKIQNSKFEILGTSLSRSRPFGDDHWTDETVKKLELEHKVRGEGGDQSAKEGAN